MDDALLHMAGITKQFGPVRALDGVNFTLRRGEVHALMGENGAGKSTLIRLLTGVHPIDEGSVALDGTSVAFSSPLEAQRGGISTVYQEVNLCPNLTVAENLYLGREPTRFGRVRGAAMKAAARDAMARVGLDLDVGVPLERHSIAVQQMVAIARAVDVEAKVLVLDEPTSSLDAGEVEQLFGVMRTLREQGMGIVFVSHFLDQVYAIADRLTVLRNGRLVGEWTTAELPQQELVAKMLGRELGTLEALDERPRGSELHALDDAPNVVRARGLGRRGAVEPFDLDIRAGEVTGLAGLLGSGRTEIARLLFGADRADEGSLAVGGDETRLRTPRAAMSAGIAFCSEDRKRDGLVEDLTVRENLMLALQATRGWTRPVPRAKQDELVRHWIETLDIRPADPDAIAGQLSGGNQQKVLLARWLITEPKLLILDEPTRGIDVGAKAQIQRLVTRLSDDGMALVYISAELEEVLRVSHKVEVLRDHRIIAELANDEELTADRLVSTIAGGTAA
jgi:simple sugar transport system ATP-binding protein